MGHEPATDPLSDEDLVRGIAAGDAGAFASLFRRRRREVYRFALHMSSAAAVADDVTQEVFLAVMKDAARYQAGRATVTAWLCGIARNHVRRRLDSERSLVPFDGRGEDEAEPGWGTTEPDALSGLVRAERIDALRRAVGTLPLRYREVVVLCDLQEMGYVDAAAAVGCAVGTVRSRLHRARALLAAKLGMAERAAAIAPVEEKTGSGGRRAVHCGRWSVPAPGPGPETGDDERQPGDVKRGAEGTGRRAGMPPARVRYGV